MNSGASGLSCQLMMLWLVSQARPSLEPRLSVPDFVSQLWRKVGQIRNREPGFEAKPDPCTFTKEGSVWWTAYTSLVSPEVDLAGAASAVYNCKVQYQLCSILYRGLWGLQWLSGGHTSLVFHWQPKPGILGSIMGNCCFFFSCHVIYIKPVVKNETIFYSQMMVICSRCTYLGYFLFPEAKTWKRERNELAVWGRNCYVGYVEFCCASCFISQSFTYCLE